MKPVSGGPQMSASATRRADERALTRRGWSPVQSPRRPVLFVNPRSGMARPDARGSSNGLAVAGIEVVLLDPGQSLATLVDEAVAGGADALGMAGGDGSLAVVAAAAAANGLPFVCVPAGPAIISRSTSEWTGTIWRARSTRSATGSSVGSTWPK